MRPPKRILIAARVLLGQTQAELAEESRLGVRTIYNAEHGGTGIESVEKLIAHFEERGIVFVKPKPEAGQGWGLVSGTLFESYDQEKRRKRKASEASVR
jgi:transcriptional regulator with XRE-family HTH domain